MIWELLHLTLRRCHRSAITYDPKDPTRMDPSIGRIVIYRSKTGNYSLPAIITATTLTLDPQGVEDGHVPPLTSDHHVHLHVLTPGGQRAYSEFDVPPAGPRGGLPLDTTPGQDTEGAISQNPRTWAWPV